MPGGRQPAGRTRPQPGPRRAPPPGRGAPARRPVPEGGRRLRGPRGVAMAGRVRSAKSTLVSALIGRRVAPTEVGECTRIVTRFRYGTSGRVDIVRRNGTRGSLPLDE